MRTRELCKNWSQFLLMAPLICSSVMKWLKIYLKCSLLHTWTYVSLGSRTGTAFSFSYFLLNIVWNIKLLQDLDPAGLQWCYHVPDSEVWTRRWDVAERSSVLEVSSWKREQWTLHPRSLARKYFSWYLYFSFLQLQHCRFTPLTSFISI